MCVKWGCVFTLQHADSMGMLLSDSSQSSLQAAASVSTLSSSVDEAETEMERPITEDCTNRWLSLDWLSMNGLDTCQIEMPFHKKKEDEKGEMLEKVRKQSGEDEEILGKDEQVADFASSVLAAISCWRYKARALLFTRVTTVRLTVTICFFPHFSLACWTFSSLLHAASDICY